nr:unnamed protein product [Spirometra erinaceieuropaei]
MISPVPHEKSLATISHVYQRCDRVRRPKLSITFFGKIRNLNLPTDMTGARSPMIVCWTLCSMLRLPPVVLRGWEVAG